MHQLKVKKSRLVWSKKTLSPIYLMGSPYIRGWEYNYYSHTVSIPTLLGLVCVVHTGTCIWCMTRCVYICVWVHASPCG